MDIPNSGGKSFPQYTNTQQNIKPKGTWFTT